MNNKENVWALQLVKYLIGSCNYVQMNVKTNYVDLNNRVDHWLVKLEDANFSIVHITDETDGERQRNIPLSKELYAKVLNFIGKDSGRVLDISLSADASNFSIENVKYIAVHPQCQLDDVVLKSFPELSKVIYDVEGDYNKNIKSLENSINLTSIAKYREARKAKIKERMKSRNKNTTAFKVISAICIIAFIGILVTSYVAKIDTVHVSIAFGAYYKAFVVVMNEYWRLLTAGFIHTSFLHLATNLMAYSYLSRVTEEYFGTGKSLLILLVSIIAGNLAVFIGDKNIIAAGLSGGLYGLMGAILVVGLQKHWFASPAYTREFLSTVMLNIFISMLPNVSFLAHLGGLVAGLFLGFILSDDSDKLIKINFAVCGVIIVAVMGYFAYRHMSFMPFYYGSDQTVANIYQTIGLENHAKDILKRCLDYYLSHGG